MVKSLSQEKSPITLLHTKENLSLHTSILNLIYLKVKNSLILLIFEQVHVFTAVLKQPECQTHALRQPGLKRRIRPRRVHVPCPAL